MRGYTMVAIVYSKSETHLRKLKLANVAGKLAKMWFTLLWFTLPPIFQSRPKYKMSYSIDMYWRILTSN